VAIDECGLTAAAHPRRPGSAGRTVQTIARRRVRVVPHDPDPTVAAARDAAGRFADVPNIAGGPQKCTYRKGVSPPHLQALPCALTAIASTPPRSADTAPSNRSSILI